MKIILASASPRRRQLLALLLNDFEVQPSTKEEQHPQLPPKKYVAYLAQNKATDVWENTDGNRLVIGSDTVVVLDGKIIGKPTDSADAENILKKLSGATHTVFTGVCLKNADKCKTFVVAAKVKFFDLSQRRIDDYIATGSSFDKAGAYGIQDSGFVRKIKGSVSCVMGLPLERLKRELKRAGVKVNESADLHIDF